jgi:hypothetical protein
MPNTRTQPRGPRDAAESWELRCSESEGREYLRGACDVFPYVPRRPEDVPTGALESLGEVCGFEALRQVFIIPWAARSTGFADQRVLTPGSVLGIGARAVALWTDRPEPGIKVAIPLERLSAIEDITILLYGRLSFLSLGDRLTIRYNTLARFALEPALLELRKRLAGPPQPLPADTAEYPELPAKWQSLLHGPLVRFHESTPVAFRFAVEPGRYPNEPDRGQLLVVNPHELVFLRDPAESPHAYGEDSFIAPRTCISRVRVREKYLELASNGARFSLSMAPGLREAAAGWFAAKVQ